jgi:hypothetical protein
MSLDQLPSRIHQKQRPVEQFVQLLHEYGMVMDISCTRSALLTHQCLISLRNSRVYQVFHRKLTDILLANKLSYVLEQHAIINFYNAQFITRMKTK